MKVVLVEPGKNARIADIDGSLKSMQEIVGGLIDVAYPWEEPVGLICNDEGLLNGMKPCRYVPGYQVICGPFFICGLGKEDFISLTNEQADRYKREFFSPELILRGPFGTMVNRTTPKKYEDFYKKLEAENSPAKSKAKQNPER